MTNTVTNILSRDEELALRKPIEDYVGKIQAEIDELREEGTNKVLEYSEEIEALKRDKIYTKSEKETRLSELNSKLQKAKEIEAKNKQPINEKIAVAEKYLKDHYQTDYYSKVVESNKYEVQKAKAEISIKSIAATCRTSSQHILLLSASVSKSCEVPDGKRTDHYNLQ